jgi:hypothetical protein
MVSVMLTMLVLLVCCSSSPSPAHPNTHAHAVHVLDSPYTCIPSDTPLPLPLPTPPAQSWMQWIFGTTPDWTILEGIKPILVKSIDMSADVCHELDVLQARYQHKVSSWCTYQAVVQSIQTAKSSSGWFSKRISIPTHLLIESELMDSMIESERLHLVRAFKDCQVVQPQYSWERVLLLLEVIFLCIASF